VRDGPHHAQGLVLAAQENGGGVGTAGRKVLSPDRMVQQGDANSPSGQVVGECEPGQTGSEDQNGLWREGRHENRERSQMPNAIASRCAMERPMRVPNTRYSDRSIFSRMRL